jgi:hypothetical protein
VSQSKSVHWKFVLYHVQDVVPRTVYRETYPSKFGLLHKHTGHRYCIVICDTRCVTKTLFAKHAGAAAAVLPQECKSEIENLKIFYCGDAPGGNNLYSYRYCVLHWMYEVWAQKGAGNGRRESLRIRLGC